LACGYLPLGRPNQAVESPPSVGGFNSPVHETFTESVTEFGSVMTDLVEPPPAEAVGDLLRWHRVDLGFTQEDLAERAGISARTVSDVERGLRSSVFRDTARRLADALELDGPARTAFAQAARRMPRQMLPPSGRADAADAMRPNLPSPLTRLIGRDNELAGIVAMLQPKSLRVVTVVGPGGIGKTRLAIEAANQLGSGFADGACFVPLAVTRDAAFVPALIAREIGLASVRKPVEEALRDHLRDREMLLVLDTFEHVLPAAAFVAELAVACPRLTFLVTSRAPLRIRGEHEVVLPPLAVPEIGADLGELDRYPAATLFLERARGVRPDLSVDSESAATIALICRRLDGLPLALELAAVRLRHLPLAAIQAALVHRLNLLVGGPRDLPLRLQTMRDAIAWSHDLLAPREQRLFRAISVFAGGWTLSAAEWIWNGSHDGLLEEMTALVDNNLVATDERSIGEPRFQMLDVIREFAAEQAEAHGETPALRRGHADFFANLAEAAEREQGGAAQESWYARLQLEQDNMRAGLGWAIQRDEGLLAQRLAGALWLYWRRHGDYIEGRLWLDRALAIPVSIKSRPPDRSSLAGGASAREGASRRKVLWGNAWISYYQGDYAHVRRLGDELVQMAKEDDDPISIRNGLTIEALVAMAEGRFDDALPPLEEGVRICRQSCPPWLLATSLLNLGQATLHGPFLARSRACLQEAMSIYAGLGDRLFIARTKGYLGYVALLSGRLDAARRLFGASLKGFRDLEERFGIAEELQAMSAQRAAEGLDERAAELAGAAHAVWASLSAQALASDRPIASRYLDAARRRLGAPAWRAAWQRGQQMGIEAAVRRALERTPAARPGRRAREK
jgi:predicted ATPase/transcriptional regulator with XRE-family HTH domain